MKRLICGTTLAFLALAGGCAASPESGSDVDQPTKIASALNASVPGTGSGVLWRKANGDLVVWDMATATDYKEFPVNTADPSWQPIGTGDFNADGSGDVFWRNIAAGQLNLWKLDDTSYNGSAGSAVPMGAVATKLGAADLGAWTPFFGDFDGDHVTDILWASPTPVSQPDASPITSPGLTLPAFRQLTWLMNSGLTTARRVSQTSSFSDHVIAVGNFDGDSANKSDVLYRAEGGDFSVKVALDGEAATPLTGPVPADWVVKGTGDFNGDGKSDVLWFNTSTGEIQIWAMGGPSLHGTRVGTVAESTGWKIQGVADIDHDGISDILWRHTNGDFRPWLMNQALVVKQDGPSVSVPTDTTFAGVIELPKPAPPDVPEIRAMKPFLNRDNVSIVLAVKVPRNRSGGDVLVREAPGVAMPGPGPFPQKIHYTQQVVPEWATIAVDAALFGAKDRASLQIAFWEQGRESAYTSTLSSPGLRLPPPAPSQMTITATAGGNQFQNCSSANGGPSKTCFELTYKDNNPPNVVAGGFALGGCELWYAAGVGTITWKPAFGGCNSIRTGAINKLEELATSVGDDTHVCFKVRQYNDGGYSPFSDVACTAAGRSPTIPATVGLLGPAMCDAAESNCNFMPKVNQSFHLRWLMCNAGTVASSAVTVQLVTQTSAPTGAGSEDFPISSIPPGQCVEQHTDPMSVATQSDWHWDVYVNQAIAGGLGWTFWN